GLRRRAGREQVGDGQAADEEAVGGPRGAVLTGGPLRAHHEQSPRRTRVAVVRAAVAQAVACADGAGLSAGGAEPAARARRVVGADGATVVAAYAVIHPPCLREEVERQVDVRGERDVQGL